LVGTLDPAKAAEVKALFAQHHLPLTVIGHVTEGRGVTLLEPNGGESEISPKGYNHFAE
jgi:thiamine monophosphate kinase